jgi:hypothetical protein
LAKLQKSHDNAILMIQVNYPDFAYQIKTLDQKEQIFDPFRTANFSFLQIFKTRLSWIGQKPLKTVFKIFNLLH